jgi:hypothetical protein
MGQLQRVIRWSLLNPRSHPRSTMMDTLITKSTSLQVCLKTNLIAGVMKPVFQLMTLTIKKIITMRKRMVKRKLDLMKMMVMVYYLSRKKLSQFLKKAKVS